MPESFCARVFDDFVVVVVVVVAVAVADAVAFVFSDCKHTKENRTNDAYQYNRNISL